MVDAEDSNAPLDQPKSQVSGGGCHDAVGVIEVLGSRVGRSEAACGDNVCEEEHCQQEMRS
jgi:hypothetical protein